MKRKFKTADYEKTLDLQISLRDVMPSDHLARFIVDVIAQLDLNKIYGQYSDQYGFTQATFGVNGSEVERIGVALDQYFGSSLIIYGKWEQLDLDVDCTALSILNAAAGTCGGGAYGGANELDSFTLGAVYFW